MRRTWTGAMLLGLSGLAAVQAGDWTQFRGPGATGLAEESKIPSEWGEEKNVAWKVRIPGVAWSCPIVVGDRVFVTTAITDKQAKPSPGKGGFGGGFPPGGARGKEPSRDRGKDTQRPRFPPRGGRGGFGRMGGGKPPDVVYRWEVHCLDRTTGKQLWKQTAIERKPTIPTHSTNTYASETPVSDGERVYAYFGMTGLFCYDLTGKLLWKKDLGSYRMMAGWGTGSSPALDAGRVFVQCDNEEKSFLVALDGRTGDEQWRVARGKGSSWCTPLVWRTAKRTEIVAAGGGKVCSYDPTTGKQLWQLTGLQGQFSASPVASAEMLYFGTGGPFGPRPLVAVRAGASGDITPKEGETTSAGVAWMVNGAGPGMASPLLYQGCLYVLDQRGGLLRCHDAKTGEVAYRQRLPQARGFTSSPWAHDGKVFCLDEEGKTFVVQAGKEFKLLRTNRLPEMFWSSPAVAAGAVYLRGVDHLYCVRP